MPAYLWTEEKSLIMLLQLKYNKAKRYPPKIHMNMKIKQEKINKTEKSLGSAVKRVIQISRNLELF